MKTNLEMIGELKDWYPEKMHIVNIKEIRFLEKHFEMGERDVLDLRNLRDMVGLWIIASDDFHSNSDTVKEMDKLSAITSVIDLMIQNKGGEL